MVKEIKRFEIWLVSLDPTIGSELQKTRPCLVVSSDELNEYLNTIIIAPLTSTTKNYPTRVECFFDGKNGEIVLDQIRTLDKTRFVKKLGILDEITSQKVCEVLGEMFEF